MLLYLFYICLLSLHLTFFGDLHWGSKESNQGPQTGTVCANKQLEAARAEPVIAQYESVVQGFSCGEQFLYQEPHTFQQPMGFV